MPETTMIYVTHDQVEAMTLADRIVVLAVAASRRSGAPLELYEKPRQPSWRSSSARRR
jgi:alpha-glucoside transport system ATP-binding protein